MADEVAGENGESSLSNTEKEEQLEPEVISKDADVKLRPGVAPIKTQ